MMILIGDMLLHYCKQKHFNLKSIKIREFPKNNISALNTNNKLKQSDAKF